MTSTNGRRIAAATAVAAATATVTGVGIGGANAHPAAVATAPVVKVTITSHAVRVKGGTALRPGTKIFDVTAKGASRTLQIVQLHKGYSVKHFRKDAAKGIDSNKPNVHAIRRLDHKVTWLGGAVSNKGKTSQFGVTLTAGRYYAFDQQGSARTKLKVSGTTQLGTIPATATVVGTSKDRWKAPKTLQRNGWIRLKDTSHEPHFLLVQRVKNSTTKKDVHRYVHKVVKTGSQNPPPWARKFSTNSGVFSRQAQTWYHLHAPAGKYVLACFWHSKTNGMPHFFMGMWKLVHLK